MSQVLKPKITWDTSFTRTLSFGWGADAMTSSPVPRPANEWAETDSGAAVDVWDVGTREMFWFNLRWIPATDLAAPVVSGWDGTSGWAAFLRWAWKGNSFRWYPDAASGTYILSKLAEPREMQKPGLDPGAYRSLAFAIFAVDGSSYTGY